MNKKQKTARGKKGAQVRWAGRHLALVELSRKYGKTYQDWFMKDWTTEQLWLLLQALESVKKDVDAK